MEIFVGNLAFTAAVDEVRRLCEAYGEVTSMHLPTDRETGRPHGFGLVGMPDAMQARAAIAGLHGTNPGSRPLTVNEACPREERDGQQRGGPRRGPRW
jgi:RNA recognition motif-containing protein